jgi:hypothetical protein
MLKTTLKIKFLRIFYVPSFLRFFSTFSISFESVRFSGPKVVKTYTKLWIDLEFKESIYSYFTRFKKSKDGYNIPIFKYEYEREIKVEGVELFYNYCIILG